VKFSPSTIAFAALLLSAGSVYWYGWNLGPSLPGPAPASSASNPHLPPPRTVNDLPDHGTASSVPPTNSTNLRTDNLPHRLYAIIARLRASGKKDENDWADALELAWSDFPAAWQLVAKAFPSRVREQREVLLLMIGQEDWHRALAGLELLSEASHRKTALGALVFYWARKDVTSLLEFAQHLEGDERSTALEKAIPPLLASGRFGEADDLLLQITASFPRKTVIREIARARGRKDPHEALLWAATIENPDEQREAISFAMSEAIPRWGTEELLELADTSTVPYVRTMCISAVAAKLVDPDANIGLAWAEQLPADLKGIAKRRIAMELAKKDPARSTSVALQLPAPDQLLDEVQRNLVKQGPERVIAWMNTLPEEYREREAWVLVGHWYHIDPKRVSSWIDQLPSGRVRNRALAALATNISKHDVSSARAVLSRIDDAQLRTAFLDTLK
jgi:hypothetical protein